MAKMTAVMTGDERLNRKLARISGKEAKKVIRKAARPAVKCVMQQARSNAKKHSNTGALGKSIKVRSIPRSRSRIGARVTTRAEDFGDRFYGAFQEYGWKAGRSKRQIKGTEDMESAAEKKKAFAMREYEQRIASGIVSLAKR